MTWVSGFSSGFLSSERFASRARCIWGRRFIWIAGLVAATGFAADSQPLALDHPLPAVRIRVYDYARVSPATLARAKATASGVLQQAGVPLEWMECRTRPEDAPKDEACALPSTTLDLYLRVLDAAMARNAGGSRQCLGFALLTEGVDCTASVFFHRAPELEKESGCPRAAILGAMMAHEIGHLLLDQSNHSKEGIMRAQWRDYDLKRISEGRMSFTADQAARMILLVAQRAR